MRTILATRFVEIPEGVTAECKAREVTITGPRGSLTRSFKHRQLDIVKVSNKRIRVDLWSGQKKELACVRTVTSHMENMITGVTKGYIYKMRCVYSHFPINVTIVEQEGKSPKIEIRNYLGEKRNRVVQAGKDVTVKKSDDVKDQIEVSGNDIEAVSLTCSNVFAQTRARNKDIRKFLDGIYVSEKGSIEQDA